MMGANYNDSASTDYGLDCFNSAGKPVACMNRISNGFAIGDWRDFITSGQGIGEVTTARNAKDTVTRIKTYGSYAATRLRITDPLSVIVGARLSWQRNVSNGVVTSDFSHQVTPYLGAVYDRRCQWRIGRDDQGL
jgi:outer membrane receptor for ferric coprogen and ferric-rhodotorulic acid